MTYRSVRSVTVSDTMSRLPKASSPARTGVVKAFHAGSVAPTLQLLREIFHIPGGFYLCDGVLLPAQSF